MAERGGQDAAALEPAASRALGRIDIDAALRLGGPSTVLVGEIAAFRRISSQSAFSVDFAPPTHSGIFMAGDIEREALAVDLGDVCCTTVPRKTVEINGHASCKEITGIKLFLERFRKQDMPVSSSQLRFSVPHGNFPSLCIAGVPCKSLSRQHSIFLTVSKSLVSRAPQKYT